MIVRLNDKKVRSKPEGEIVEISQTTHTPALSSSTKLIALWSAQGSQGRTTTAVNLAASAAAKARVLLIDLDFVAPSLSQLSGTAHQSTLSTTVHAFAVSKRIDQAFLDEHAPVFGAGRSQFRLMGGLARAERWPEIATSTFLPMLAELAPHFDLVIFDLQASSHKLTPANALARALLESAHSVIALANANPLSLSRLLRELGDLQALRPRHARLVTVFNRLPAKPSPPAESQAFVQLTRLSAPLLLRDDDQAFEQLARNGVAQVALRKRSNYRTDMQSLLDACLGL